MKKYFNPASCCETLNIKTLTTNKPGIIKRIFFAFFSFYRKQKKYSIRCGIKQFFVLFCLIMLLVLPYFVFAQTPALDKLKVVGSNQGPYAEANETSVSGILGTAVNALLSMLGTIFIILIIIAGFNWMTAAGDEEKLTKAKNTIRRSIVGVLIVAGAYAIWQFILFKAIIGLNT